MSPVINRSRGRQRKFRVARDSIRIVKAPRSALTECALPLGAPASFGSCDPYLARRERTNRDVISVRISERELLRSSIRIDVWFLFEPTDERACPLKR
jgi:hypothetical protein